MYAIGSFASDSVQMQQMWPEYGMDLRLVRFVLWCVHWHGQTTICVTVLMFCTVIEYCLLNTHLGVGPLVPSINSMVTVHSRKGVSAVFMQRAQYIAKCGQAAGKLYHTYVVQIHCMSACTGTQPVLKQDPLHASCSMLYVTAGQATSLLSLQQLFTEQSCWKHGVTSGYAHLHYRFLDRNIYRA